MVIHAVLHMLLHSSSLSGLTEVGIFRLPGQASRIHALKQLYDAGSQQDFLPSEDIHTVASLLKLYFRELPEPVVPFVSYHSFKNDLECEYSRLVLRTLNLLCTFCACGVVYVYLECKAICFIV